MLLKKDGCLLWIGLAGHGLMRAGLFFCGFETAINWRHCVRARACVVRFACFRCGSAPVEGGIEGIHPKGVDMFAALALKAFLSSDRVIAMAPEALISGDGTSEAPTPLGATCRRIGAIPGYTSHVFEM